MMNILNVRYWNQDKRDELQPEMSDGTSNDARGNAASKTASAGYRHALSEQYRESRALRYWCVISRADAQVRHTTGLWLR
jgi:hypothetical protein